MNYQNMAKGWNLRIISGKAPDTDRVVVTKHTKEIKISSVLP